MITKRWSVDNSVDKEGSYSQFSQAADLLKNNEVVAFPTETVYGLGGNAENDDAVKKIFQAKGRPSDNPLIIHIADKAQLDGFVTEIPQNAQALMNVFWPGPLTLIFILKGGVLSQYATAGLSTVAVRMPDHPVALELLKKTGLPIAAPSANRSGRPSPTTAEHVWEDLNGRIAGLVDGGPTGVGVESTVVDCTGEVPVILRPGGITREQLEEVVGDVSVDPALADESQAPKSPGMKYRHYAPDAPLYLVEGTREDIQHFVDDKKQEGLSVGVLTTVENREFYHADYVYACGQREKLETVASSLYEALRYFNTTDADVIFCEMFPGKGVGHAIMNRLMKAAGHRVISR
ncbi:MULTISPECIES: L-threonylcarbamoyladenylate synthase [unclassified Cytobacillus]|uniref:L-threonylcarbamoyladenylate synthase n=1 Tax=unclassified Cytobacillus TaxID=2675268 RepID=UPI00135A6937|nr:L-threonylcarbamoyladenylate synthase [Cytobacillus sp. AMY 15.2]KAF0819062.1 Threonylcarbamoyl-AMP synthase [Bacillus sp. ZZV12-4809]MCM3090830.1 L-threonylcarbamoyladenylate synthase [Cytobacillus sp. AMY 15.2]